MDRLDDETIARLIKAAHSAMDHAYPRYSDFFVGAALLMDDGQVITGGNIENASFGATICAERSAISTAMGQGYTSIRAVAVSNKTTTKITPCGICRQVIFEFGKDIPVICSNEAGEYVIYSSAELLPHAFTLDE